MFGNLSGFRHGKNVGIGNLVLLFGDPVEGEQGVAEIIIAKQRNGPTGVVKLAFIDKWTRFENLAFDRE